MTRATRALRGSSLCVAGVVVGSLALLQCSGGPPAAAPATGTLVVDWTLDGSDDPNLCAQSSVDSLVVDVSDGSEFRAPCDAMSTSIDLPSGQYTASATLVDSTGQDRTTSVDLAPFTIDPGTTLHVPIDFPASSFH